MLECLCLDLLQLIELSGYKFIILYQICYDLAEILEQLAHT